MDLAAIPAGTRANATTMQSLRAHVLLVVALGCTPTVIEATDDVVGESADSSTESSESGTSESGTTSDSSSTEPADADWGTDTGPTTSTSETTDPTTDTDPTETTTAEGPSDCTSNIDCVLGNCLAGACVQVESCKQLAELDSDDTLGDGVYQIDADADGPLDPFDVYCDMTHDGGGWTLVLKSDGNATTFAYDSAQWGSTMPFQPEFPDLDYEEAKLASYSTVAFDELLVGLEVPISDQDMLVPALEWLVMPIAGDSLHALIQPGTLIPSNVGRDAWLGLVMGGALQPNCNLEGLNVRPSNMMMHHRIRIGIVANEQNDCNTPNSRIGIGGAGDVCNTLSNPTGNFVGCNAGDEPNLIGFGAVLVR